VRLETPGDERNMKRGPYKVKKRPYKVKNVNSGTSGDQKMD
jgi:hypothetical protein